MMETILKAYGLWKVIDETHRKKETSGKQETTIDEKAENTAKGMIFQTLTQDMLMQVAQYTTAKEVWNSIKIKHIGADLVQKARLQTLRSELETLKMKPHKSTSEFTGKLSSIQAKFKSLGGNPTTSTERVFETYKNVKQKIRDQLNAEAEAVQIILTGIDSDIYSTV
nr:zinc finger, CCHC-type [Tanacetum cinerariifolium]